MSQLDSEAKVKEEFERRNRITLLMNNLVEYEQMSKLYARLKRETFEALQALGFGDSFDSWESQTRKDGIVDITYVESFNWVHSDECKKAMQVIKQRDIQTGNAVKQFYSYPKLNFKGYNRKKLVE